MKCTCAVADSFNVRPSDLVNPTCPVHGTIGKVDARLRKEREEAKRAQAELAEAQEGFRRRVEEAEASMRKHGYSVNTGSSRPDIRTELNSTISEIVQLMTRVPHLDRSVLNICLRLAQHIKDLEARP